MSKKNKTIPVLGSGNLFLSYTTPAKARLMLKSGDCSVFNDNPFIIKKNGELKDNMVKRKLKNGTDFIKNWTNYFAEESEIFIQNLTSTNLSIEMLQGSAIVSISIPCTRKPLNLTQFATFESIKESLEFRKMVNRKPAAIRLLSEKEYDEYFTKLAKKYNTIAEDEMIEAQDQFSALMNKKEYIPSDLERAVSTNSEDTILNTVEPDPRVVGLCEGSSTDQVDRLTQRQVLESLEVFEGELKLEDWNYLSSKMTSGYKQVISYAVSMIEKISL